MIIYLIGFMGVGKTTISKKLCSRLDYKLIDTDEEIVKRQGMEIKEIFETRGEDYFRQLEAELIEEIAKEDDIVVSCGGGVIKNPDNVTTMKKSGEVILLEASPEVIYRRVKNTDDRPLLRGRNSVEGIRELLEERMPLYEAACTKRVESVASRTQVCDAIMELLQ